MHRSGDESLLGTAVKTPPGKSAGSHRDTFERSLHGVCQLDFTAGPRSDVLQIVKNGRFENIAAYYSQRGRRLFRLRLLDQTCNRLRGIRLNTRDTVEICLFTGDILHSDNVSAAFLFPLGDQFPNAGARGVNKIIGQNHSKGGISDNRLCAENGVPQPLRGMLAGENQMNAWRADGTDDIEKLFLSL